MNGSTTMDSWELATDAVAEARQQLQRMYALPANDLRDELARAQAMARAADDLRDALVELGLTALDYEYELVDEPVETVDLDAPANVEAYAPGDDTSTNIETDADAPDEPPQRETRPTPPPVAVTPAHLNALRQALGQRRFVEEEQAEATRQAMQQRSVREVRSALELLRATPHKLTNRGAISREVARLVGSGERWQAWADAGRAANYALTAWVTARARAAQKAAQLRGMQVELDALMQLFPALSNHSKRTQPGVIHGLALKHTPREGSWLADARAAEAEVKALIADTDDGDEGLNDDDQLRRLTDAVRDGLDAAGFTRWAQRLLDADMSPRTTRLARLATSFADELPDELAELRRAAQAEIEAETHEDEPRERIVPDDWGWRHHTDGRSAVIVGGAPRPERVARLHEEFGFSSLDWIDNASGAGKRLDSLLERMRHGTVDMVIMMRAFSSHTLTDATFGLKDRACDLVLADTYGVTQVRLAIERFLDRA